MATHSGILARIIPWTEEPCRHSPWGYRVRHDLVTKNTHTHTHTHIPHIFFFHLSVSGCLGCFDILAFVNNAAMTMETLNFLG